MKYTGFKLTQALGLLVLAGFASSANAVPIIISFDDQVTPTQSYTIGNYIFEDVQINNGQCGAVDPCINFKAKTNFTLKRTDNLEFLLTQFWFGLEGQTAVLTLQDGLASFAPDTWGNGGNTVYNSKYAPNAGQTDLFALDASSSIFFQAKNGNIRLDDFYLLCTDDECPSDPEPPTCPDPQNPACDPTGVPEPGTLGLLGLGLLGLAGRRRTKV